MIKIENVTFGDLDPVIRGMRNPMNSWERSDSYETTLFVNEETMEEARYSFVVGENDLALMMRLAKAGSVDAKYRRMMTVYLDITAPLYWWKEFDTYKVGTVVNSCSTMHTIHAKEFTFEDFSHEHLTGYVDSMDNDEGFSTFFSHEVNKWLCSTGVLKVTIEALNEYRKEFLRTGDKFCWWQIIQLLPSSYNQRRTVMLNYEVLTNIYQHRRNHKLDEWREFCAWIKTLPYSEIITLTED